MMPAAWLQLVVFFALLLALGKVLGEYLAAVYEGRRTFLAPVLGPVERLLYRWAGVAPTAEMNWREYAVAALVLNFAGLAVVYALQRAQGQLPLNPQQLGPVAPDLALNTAVSFATNTNWQSYSGETTLSYLTQLLGLTVQNFLSAATGLAVLVALIRGLTRPAARTLGNFWVDLTRSTLYILLPLSLVLALALVSQGVVQTLRPAQAVTLTQPFTAAGRTLTAQTLALGPAASQVAIKQLGTNGGGFFGANSAHPFENPTPLSNFLECLAILLLPVALCFTFGRLVGDTRQGRVLLAAMGLIFVVMLGLALAAEQVGNPALTALGVDQVASHRQPGGNLEGKEVRFGLGASALWAVATTAASNGSVNALPDSLTPLGGLAALWLMQLGEVVFGGVGSGLYGLLAFVIIAVFIAGLMVGRTPEYLGKKIETYEMKMAALIVLLPPILVLVGTAEAELVRVVLGRMLGKLCKPGNNDIRVGKLLYAPNGTRMVGVMAWAKANNVKASYDSLKGVATLTIKNKKFLVPVCSNRMFMASGIPSKVVPLKDTLLLGYGDVVAVADQAISTKSTIVLFNDTCYAPESDLNKLLQEPLSHG